MRKSLNIAVPGKGFTWGGGSELLRNFANALLSAQEEVRVKLFLLLPVKNKIASLTDFRQTFLSSVKSTIHRRRFTFPKSDPIFDPSFFDYFCNVDGDVEIVEYNDDFGLISTLKKIEADVVLPSVMPLGKNFPFPWVGYIYDFQHKYFPEYFDADTCLQRDIQFARMLREAKSIIVNARAVKDDIEKFFPYHDSEVFNLPFSAAPVSGWLESADLGIQERYDLPERYCLISNQFWIHKSHITAFRALAMLSQMKDCDDLHIVCTGKMEDYRFPKHIDELRKSVRDLGIEDKVHFLGHIPKKDQVAIMKNSIAVLQPTLFEGGPGGGSIYDAVSLGVPAILSDIRVNLEIKDEKNIFYFKAGSEYDLVSALKRLLSIQIQKPTKKELVLSGEKRKRLVGERLLSAARTAIAHSK